MTMVLKGLHLTCKLTNCSKQKTSFKSFFKYLKSLIKQLTSSKCTIDQLGTHEGHPYSNNWPPPNALSIELGHTKNTFNQIVNLFQMHYLLTRTHNNLLTILLNHVNLTNNTKDLCLLSMQTTPTLKLLDIFMLMCDCFFLNHT